MCPEKASTAHISPFSAESARGWNCNFNYTNGISNRSVESFTQCSKTSVSLSSPKSLECKGPGPNEFYWITIQKKSSWNIPQVNPSPYFLFICRRCCCYCCCAFRKQESRKIFIQSPWWNVTEDYDYRSIREEKTTLLSESKGHKVYFAWITLFN